MRSCTAMAVYIGLVVPLLLTQGGCTNVLAFATATKFGLDIAQRADQTIDVTMGYDRAETASIPVPKKEELLDADGNSDTYSVLGTFRVRYDTPWGEEPLELEQFFATGLAARKASKSPELGKVFGRKAGCIARKTSGGTDDSTCTTNGGTNDKASTKTSGAGP